MRRTSALRRSTAVARDLAPMRRSREEQRAPATRSAFWMSRRKPGNVGRVQNPPRPTLPRQRVTIKDVAVACGVAVSTVSNALTGRRFVLEDTRKQILEAAERVG